MVQVIFKKSPKKDKKLRAIFTLEDGKKKNVDFGAIGYMDYTLYNKREGKKKADEKKEAYLARHKVNEDWSDYMTAGSLSRYILWNKPTVAQSISDYKKKFNLN